MQHLEVSGAVGVVRRQRDNTRPCDTFMRKYMNSDYKI